MESEFRKELISSHEFHFSKHSELKNVLEVNGHPTINAYVLHWTPDQTEDIFTILINGAYIVTTELDRFDTDVVPVVERLEIKAY